MSNITTQAQEGQVEGAQPSRRFWTAPKIIESAGSMRGAAKTSPDTFDIHANTFPVASVNFAS